VPRSLLPLFLALFVLVLRPGAPRAQAPEADPGLVAAIDKLVRKKGVTDGTPGVAVLVHQPGRLHFAKGYGLANLRDKTPVTPRTMFELASLSKPFTATAVLILHQRGDLSIQDDVRKYLPELPAYRKDRPIRVVDLLQHTSGLPDYLTFEDVPARHKDYWVNEDYAAEFTRRRKEVRPAFPPGDRHEYSNTNYMLLALVVQRVARKSFGTFLREEVFTPAGMKHSFVYESPDAVPRRLPAACTPAIGYEKERKKWQEAWGAPPLRHEKQLAVGDGSVWSNLEDMARWDAAVRGGKLLEPATARMALVPARTLDGKKNDYGLGWVLYLDKGKMNGYGHDGSWGGFETSYYRYLGPDRSAVILSNRDDFDPDAFWYPLNDILEEHLARKK
jgi:CubicO group peptidase (beta-lactamase class C family)